jgi:hypothetical protein
MDPCVRTTDANASDGVMLLIRLIIAGFAFFAVFIAVQICSGPASWPFLLTSTRSCFNRSVASLWALEQAKVRRRLTLSPIAPPSCRCRYPRPQARSSRVRPRPAARKRLSRICLSLMESAVSAPRFSCASTMRRFLFFSASCPAVPMTSSMSRAKFTGSRLSSSFPASIFERSST